MKDPAMICRIQPHMEDWKLSIIGCENSISSVSMYDEDLAVNPAPYTPAFRPRIYQHTLAKDGTYKLSDKEKAKDGVINSYDSYQYEFGMNSLGTSKASWCGYKLSNPDEYGNRMEYTMIESFLLTLPIMNRHFADHGVSPEGKKWGEYYGPLISQAREETELAEILKEMSAEEWTRRTKACRDLIFKFNDIESIGQKFLDDVIKMGKRENKVVPIDVISEYFPSAKERRANGELVMSSANGTLKQTPMIMEEGKQVIVKEKPITNTLEEFF